MDADDRLLRDADDIVELPRAKPAAPKPQPAPVASSPVLTLPGRWLIIPQDETGVQMDTELNPDGTFMMLQYVGAFKMPVNGTWLFNPLTQTLSLNGVVNTFQPLVLSLAITGKLGADWTATGADGVTYLLRRPETSSVQT